MSDWGDEDENNWRKFLFAISEHDDVYENEYEGGRWSVEWGIITIAGLNKHWTQLLLKTEGYLSNENLTKFFTAIMKRKADKMYLSVFIRTIRFLIDTQDKEEINVLTDTVNPYIYDECGITNIVDGTKGEDIWVVWMDMHS